MTRKKLTEKRLVEILRAHAQQYLRLPNVTSVGVGYRVRGGEPTKELCIQYTVARKLSLDELEDIGFEALPETIDTPDGLSVPVDVLERDYHPTWEVVLDTAAEELRREEEAEEDAHDIRRSRQDTLRPGISVSHPSGTAGTLGAIVYDRSDGQPYMLSNWHVLAGGSAEIGDDILQPGPYDDSNLDENRAGALVRSHLGLAGDCAIAAIQGREFDESILEIDRAPARAAKVALGDRVVKSGRTTGVTYGVVKRVGVVVNINYGGQTGTRSIGGFEIGPDPENLPSDGEVSKGGDSGSLWMINADAGQDGDDVAVGLHFAGETDPSPAAEHALACNIHSVLEKLDVDFVERDAVFLSDEELWNETMARMDLLSLRVQALEGYHASAPSGVRSGSCDSPGAEAPVQAMAMASGGGAVGVAPELSLPVYGNWCGPGHGGGKPIDDVDKACRRHDKCYGKKGYFDCTCDAHLLQDLDRALASGRVKPLGMVMGPIIRGWFRSQPCVYHVGGVPISAGTGGTAKVVDDAYSVAKSGVKAVTKGGKKVWKKVKSWF